MRILVVNDDGIEAIGIKELVNAMEELGEVIVAAPSKPKSGAGHSFTCDGALTVHKVQYSENIPGYSVDGTPRDCVEFALRYYPTNYFDIVVSGINKGANIGNNIACSGTCGAACACLDFNVPAIAFSLEYGKQFDYSFSKKMAKKYTEWFVNNPLNKKMVLNINIPNIPESEIQGEVVSGHGGRFIYNTVGFKELDQNTILYDSNLTSIEVEEKEESLNSDSYALAKGYVTISPISLQMIRDDFIEELKNAL